MARQQYRWVGEAAWQSMSGNAILAIQNKNGSGKKILVHSFEVLPQTVGTTTGLAFIDLVRGSSSANGVGCLISPHDTDNIFPADIKIQKFCDFTPSGTVLSTRFFGKNLSLGAQSGLCNNWQRGGLNKNQKMNALISQRAKDIGLENIVIRPGESIGISQRFMSSSQILQLNYTLVVRGTPNKTFSGQAITWLASGNNSASGSISTSPFVITNNSVSDIIELVSLDITELGTLDTPYLQLVPIGSIDPQSQADPIAIQSVTKMDSIYPDLDSNKIALLTDAPLLPLGVPVTYISGSSTGSPKGYNYLHTKDFIGPQFFTYFPEHNRYSSTGILNDMSLVPLSNKGSRLMGDKGSPIVIREGEQIGIVSGAETAVTTNPIGTSGWQLLQFAITFSVENANVPELNLTGLQPNTEVRVMIAGTNTEIAGQESVSGTFTWQYDFDLYPSVDINIVSLGYEILRYNNLSLNSTTGVTIPVTQRIDRNYLNT